MAILHGYLNLSKIDKSLISTNNKGEKILWVDIYTYDNPDQFGNNACVVTYDARNRKKEYLGNFRPKELHKSEDAGQPGNDDLGF